MRRVLLKGRHARTATHRSGPLRMEALEARRLLAGDLVISEFVANNQLGLRDEDSDRPDWIEIYNRGSEPVDLDGYSLTDDPQDLSQWTFPTTVLDPRSYQVVFASGKDRRVPGQPLHTNFRLSAGGESLLLVEPDGVTRAHDYIDFPAQHENISFGTPQPIDSTVVLGRESSAKYLIPAEAHVDLAWMEVTFDDSAWNDGVGSIGYDHTGRLTEFIDTDVQAEMQNINTTAFARYTFQMSDVSAIHGLQLSMRYDDGYVAYLNGVEVARRNAPDELTFEARASDSRPSSDKPLAEAADISIFRQQLVVGNNVLAVHGLNRSIRSSYFVSPELIVQRPGDVADDQARFFATPTPGAPNGDISFGGVLGSIELSLPHGFYESAQQVVITGTDPGASIAYTLDGSTPSAENGVVIPPSQPNLVAMGTVPITQTTILRATTVKDDAISQPPQTRTYIFVEDVITQSPEGEAPEGWPSRRINGQLFTYGMDPDVVEDPLYAPLMRDALLDISSISIVTDQEHLFDPDTGIYVNGRTARAEGTANWERPTSVELIHPDGTQGFQIDAGIRMRGGASRSPENPKHAFRFFFRGEYGETKLRYPMFGEEGVDEFDAIDLRTPSLISWHWCFPGSERFRCENNTFLRDVFARDTQREMGHPYTRSRYYHVYLNGQYWGLYQSQERPEASFAESYLGGNKEDYDVIKVEVEEPARVIAATDGNLDAWHQLWEQAAGGFESDEAYLRAQGRNLDGTRNPDYPVLLNVENLIDYMILQFYGGNLDGPISDNIGNTQTNNWISIRNRNSDEGFLFFAHDSEYILLNVNENRLAHWPVGRFVEHSNPQWLHQQLTQNRSYREMFADRAYQHLFNDGVLTPEAARRRVEARIEEIELAIIAESARWGDSNRRIPYTKEDWVDAVSHIVDNYIPRRTEIFVEQLKQAPLRQFSDLVAPLFPNVETPAFSQHGGRIGPDFALTISAEDAVYFTLDGSDPRRETPRVEFELLVDEGDALRYLVPSDSSLGSEWTARAFDDSVWFQGNSAVGFEQTENQLADAIATDLADSMFSVNATVYVRIPFSVDDPSAFDVMQLAMQYDDGFVAYLNGVEVARSNVGRNLDWDAEASARRSPAVDLRVFETVDLTDRLELLRSGDNLLAIHGLNRDHDDDDFFLLPQLRAGILRDAGVSPSAQRYTAPLMIDENTMVSARALRGHQWSALNQVTFTVESLPLRVSEIMYHPSDPTGTEFIAGFTDDDDFEYIELENRSTTQPLDLAGVTLSQAIDFTFPPMQLGPGQQVIVARNREAFRFRYGAEALIAGQYGENEAGARLSNAGETIQLADRLGVVVQELTYDDAWYPTTDGGGFSLETRLNAAPETWSTAAAWRASAAWGGSPGQSGRLNGDVNGDGVFDSGDLVLAAQSGEYEDDEINNSTFDEGDWNGDGEFDSRDLVLVFQLGAFQLGASVAERHDLAPKVGSVEYASVVATLDSSRGEDDKLGLLRTDSLQPLRLRW